MNRRSFLKALTGAFASLALPVSLAGPAVACGAKPENDQWALYQRLAQEKEEAMGREMLRHFEEQLWAVSSC